MRVKELAAEVISIGNELVDLSRLYSLRVLAERDRHAKLVASANSAQCIDHAASILDFASRYYQYKQPAITWTPGLHPQGARILSRGRIDYGRLSEYIRGTAESVLNSISVLERDAYRTLMATPIRPMLEQLKSTLPLVDRGPTLRARHKKDSTNCRGVRKVIQGPTTVQIDPIFTVGYSLLDEPMPAFGESLTETVRYLWTVCVGETMAAELCALSAVEYDGLPMAFYRDMGKQAWDEMRHAVGYLDVALSMIPELDEQIVSGSTLQHAIRKFKTEGRGLPIPRELNLYETILNASLEERLILFQIQTEAPGAARKKQNLRTELCRRYPDLAAVLEYDLLDEISHARIGRTWLKYLVPEPQARAEVIANTSLLRSVLLMTSFAHHGGGSLTHLLDNFLVARTVN